MLACLPAFQQTTTGIAAIFFPDLRASRRPFSRPSFVDVDGKLVLGKWADTTIVLARLPYFGMLPHRNFFAITRTATAHVQYQS